jgi:hypothetical protein
LGTLGTLRLCGESLLSLKAGPFSRERWGARVRFAGIVPAESPASGLLRRPAFTSRQGPFEGEAPWALCTLCVSAVNPYILRRRDPSPGKGEALASDSLALCLLGRPQAGSYADRLPRLVRVLLQATNRLRRSQLATATALRSDCTFVAIPQGPRQLSEITTLI